MTFTQATDPDRRRIVVTACAAALGAVVLGAVPARATGVDAQTPQVELDRDGVYVSATAVFALPRSMEEALVRGIPLYFLTTATVSQERWYWFNQTTGSAKVLTRLAYLPLLQKYRVSSGGLQRSYDNLDDALGQVQRVLRLKVADAHDLSVGQAYQVDVHFELDLSQLPRPFQLDVSSQSDWKLEADFPRVTFTWKPPPSTG